VPFRFASVPANIAVFFGWVYFDIALRIRRSPQHAPMTARPQSIIPIALLSPAGRHRVRGTGFFWPDDAILLGSCDLWVVSIEQGIFNLSLLGGSEGSRQFGKSLSTARHAQGIAWPRAGICSPLGEIPEGAQSASF